MLSFFRKNSKSCHPERSATDGDRSEPAKECVVERPRGSSSTACRSGHFHLQPFEYPPQAADYTGSVHSPELLLEFLMRHLLGLVIVTVLFCSLLARYYKRRPEMAKRHAKLSQKLLDKMSEAKDRDLWVP